MYVCMYVCMFFPKVALLSGERRPFWPQRCHHHQVDDLVVHMHFCIDCWVLFFICLLAAWWTRSLRRGCSCWLSICCALWPGSCRLAGCHRLCRILLILPLSEWRGEMQPFRSGPGCGHWCVLCCLCPPFTCASWLCWRCGFEEGVDRWGSFGAGPFALFQEVRGADDSLLTVQVKLQSTEGARAGEWDGLCVGLRKDSPGKDC